MKPIASLILAALLCGSAIAAEVTLQGVNGNAVTLDIVEVSSRGILANKDGERAFVKWAQIDMAKLKADHPEIEQERLDSIDREQNGVFAKTQKPKPPAEPVEPEKLPASVSIPLSSGGVVRGTIRAVYVEGVRVTSSAGSVKIPSFLKWEEINETKLFRDYPGLRSNKAAAGPVPAPLEGKFIAIDAKWAPGWSSKDAKRKLNVTVRGTAGKAGEIVLECYYAAGGTPSYSGVSRVVNVQANKAETIEFDLPVRTVYGSKSQGDWIVRVWSDSIMVGVHESTPGIAAKIANKTEPTGTEVYSGAR